MRLLKTLSFSKQIITAVFHEPVAMAEPVCYNIVKSTERSVEKGNGNLENGTNNRRQEIIEAAIDLIVEHGIDAASMQDIASAAGISKATLYFYFDSKVELVQTVYQYCYSMDAEACREGMDEEHTAIDKLCRRFMNIIHYAIRHPRESMVERIYSTSPLYCENPAGLKREYYEDIEAIIREGIEKKEIRNADARLLATAYYGMASQIYLGIWDDGSLWNKQNAETCKRMIIGMFAADQAQQ